MSHSYKGVLLGTSGHLYAVRYDELIRAGNDRELDFLTSHEPGWLYRFPWPDEDGEEIRHCRYRDLRMLTLDIRHEPGSPFSPEKLHLRKSVQYPSVRGIPFDVQLPCPAIFPDAEEYPLESCGYPHRILPIVIIGERKSDEGLYTVFACGHCMAHFHCTEKEELDIIRIALHEQDNHNIAERLKPCKGVHHGRVYSGAA
jgi:hypothetical protein